MKFDNIDRFVLFSEPKDENPSRLCKFFDLSETGCNSNFMDSCFLG